MNSAQRRDHRFAALWTGVVVSAVTAVLVAQPILDLPMANFFVPGTQIGDVNPHNFESSQNCRACHSNTLEGNDPYSHWSGSLMALGAKDPIFYAQMTLAVQDVPNAGYYCLRCHVPNSIITGTAATPDGSALSGLDLEGVNCHFCHSMVDPIYRPGVSPPEDHPILTQLAEIPEHYGNAMFVLDPSGTRRGPRHDAQPLHDLIQSDFHRSGNFCGTCHDVGNVVTTRQPDGTYRYNAVGVPSESGDPWTQFPLERTFTEWQLSSFANGGVDMGGVFGGVGATVVSSCQDCHMPRVAGRASPLGPHRTDLAKHSFAGASAQVLDLIAAFTAEDPTVNQQAIARNRAEAVSMLQRAATLQLAQDDATLNVRVINQTGHKLPTGHIEGRRVWINVRLTDAHGNLVAEYGGYDNEYAELDTETTTVYEMHVGLSEHAAAATGLQPGPTMRMTLADTIEKDNRIPPRGFVNESFNEGGAPVVGATYEDGQHWDDVPFRIPRAARHAEVAVYYQNTPKYYIEYLRDANVTDHWGQTLYDLWVQTGRGAPILMTSQTIQLTSPCPADFDNSGGPPNINDYFHFLTAFFAGDPSADINQSGGVPDLDDFVLFFQLFFQHFSNPPPGCFDPD